MGKRFIGNVKGVGVSNYETEFYLSSSGSVLSDGSWSLEVPALGDNKYLWTRGKMTLTDSTVIYTTPKNDGVWEEIYGIYDVSAKVDQFVESIETNTKNIATNTANITNNTSDISTLKTRVDSDIWAVTRGGTGATNASDALTNLGIGDYVVEQSIDTTGASGYTKWNSGKLEQWGSVTISASNGTASAGITFPTAFLNTNFNLTMTGGRNFGSGCYLWEGNSAGNITRTTQSAVIHVLKTGQNYAMDVAYKAVGRWK